MSDKINLRKHSQPNTALLFSVGGRASLGDDLLTLEAQEYLEMLDRFYPEPLVPRITLAEDCKIFSWKALAWFLFGAALFVLGIVGLFQMWTD